MKYGRIKRISTENGIGCRTSLFVSGCRRHCRNCQNAEAWSFDYGEEFTEDIEEYILMSLEPWYVDGLSVLGGEPLEPENMAVLLPFLQKVRARYPGKDIWLYTGFTYEDVKDLPILRYVDILVDGEYIDDLRDLTLAFRGSSNQRIIKLK